MGAQGMRPFPGQGGGQGGGMLDSGSTPPGGGMPGVGTPERKAEYDRRNWAYDDTIDQGFNITPPTPGQMLTPFGAPIWAGQQLYDNWDVIQDYLPTPSNIGGLAADAYNWWQGQGQK